MDAVCYRRPCVAARLSEGDGITLSRLSTCLFGHPIKARDHKFRITEIRFDRSEFHAWLCGFHMQQIEAAVKAVAK